MRKWIIITNTFQKQLKKRKLQQQEQEIAKDIKEFITDGLKKGETYLKTLSIFEIKIQIFKLRIYIVQQKARYLVGVINNKEYLPFIIDFKKGRTGKNMGFNTNKKTVKKIITAITNTVQDYTSHTEENPRMTIYELDN
jgi:hypothetical protein